MFEEIMEKLRRMGLNGYEAKSYLALLRFGAQTGREVSKKSGVPPTRVFDILKSLREKGLVNLIQEKPMIWTAIKPEIGMRGFIVRKIDDMKEIEKELIVSLKKIKSASPKPKIHEKVIVASGYQNLYGLATQYLKSCKKNFFVYSVGEKIPYSLKIESKKAMLRRVKLKLIVTKYDNENKSIVKERIKEGWEVKYLPGASEFTFGIYDKEVTLINVRNPDVKEEKLSVIFENTELTKAFTKYFNTLWNKARAIF